MKVLLGTNEITDCRAVLIVNGVEVFRLRERDKDGRLIVDFDIRDSDGNRLAKVAKNNVVHSADGYSVKHGACESAVISPDSSTPIARVEELSENTVRITGEFWIKGHHVSITEAALVSGGKTMSGNRISGFGAAIKIDPGSFSIGC